MLASNGTLCASKPLVSIENHPPGADYYSNVRYEMVPFLPPQFSRVLEVGCGEGFFALLLERQCETWGVEMNPLAAGRAKTRMNRVLVGTFEAVQAELPEHYFDLVVCNDVIEHMPDPEAFLAAVKTRMVPGAFMIVSLPNMRHWEVLRQLLIHKDWRYANEGILDRTHLRFFTEKSIRRLFEQSGFDIVRISGINGVFDPVRKFAFLSLAVLTLGYYSDTQFRQFGVLARLR